MNESKKLAKIAVNKSFLKEYSNSKYSRIVYLKDNSEFQIQLFNNYDFTIGIEISIDNKELGNKLILRPGERIWLERYFDSPNKFLFVTYEVNGNSTQVKKAIKNNGEINIKFYKEKQYYINSWWEKQIPVTWTTYSIDDNGIKYRDTSEIYCNTSSLDSDVHFKSLTASCALTNPQIEYCSNKIETGRVEKGNYSNQKFNKINIELEDFPFKYESIKILPESQKQFNSNDLKKQYCTNCGRKIKEQFKFCPYCGEKV